MFEGGVDRRRPGIRYDDVEQEFPPVAHAQLAWSREKGEFENLVIGWMLCHGCWVCAPPFSTLAFPLASMPNSWVTVVYFFPSPDSVLTRNLFGIFQWKLPSLCLGGWS